MESTNFPVAKGEREAEVETVSRGRTASAPARLLLVRHGQIDANVRGVWHGSTDSPLTALGREQAHRVAAHLAATRPGAVALYTSPLQRTRATAERIAAAMRLDPEPVPDLAEFGIGGLEGVSYDALISEHRFFEQIFEDPDYSPPGGESLRAVVERVTQRLATIARRHAGEDVIAVGHGASLALALAELIDADPASWYGYQLSNASISELVLEPRPRLLRFDETDHLESG